MSKTRFIFVVGGVMSGVGKGTTTASLGRILDSKGFKVTAIKIDPYINVDAGTMNPLEHGEVFVTEDGDETDQDVGNYERFLDTNILSDNYMTTGRVYLSVIQKERNLEYGGKCVEVVPHVPEEVIRRIEHAAELAQADFCLIEVGGTVGEYQNILFLEAARMMHLKRPGDVMFILVSYLPIPSHVGEMKTKPTQYATRTLNSAGIQPNFIVARGEQALDEPRKEKLSVFCNVHPDEIIAAPDWSSVYEVPVYLDRQEQFGKKVLDKFGLAAKRQDLDDWEQLVKTIKSVKDEVRIGIVGKYFASGKFVLSDSYISVIEAIKHACWYWKKKPVIDWLNSVDYEKDKSKLKELDRYDGVLIPGGFGSRGVEGKILAIQYVREQEIPYFGLCYGMQLATIEFARHVAKLADAHTTEINSKTPHPVINIMPGQERNVSEKKYGGTLRLGAYPCVLKDKTKTRSAYGTLKISERHRHRYEVNNDYREPLEKLGLQLVGLSPDKKLVEIIELKDHPFFIGTQFHPEFLSRPLKPHPLFREFIKAAIKRRGKK